MTEEKTRLIHDEMNGFLKPNFEVEDLRKIVEENSTKNLEILIKFIEGVYIAVKNKKSIAIKDRKDRKKIKGEEIFIDINKFNEFDYLNFALILTAINVGEVMQMHLRKQSVVPIIKEKKKSSSSELTNEHKQKLLNTLFDKYCTIYKFTKIKNYIESEKSYKESKIEKKSLEEGYEKAKEELSKQIADPVGLLTLLEIIDCLDTRFDGFKTDLKILLV